jgi:glycosyltransferase involved in cell wall biosynthesis
MSVYIKEKPSYLIEAINSVLNQTLVPDEIVIVEDGEVTVELRQILDDFCNQYSNLFKLVKLEKNMGLGKALEIGVNECKYDIIARMDTDDICVPNRFEKQILFLKENKNIDIVGSWIGEFDKDVNELTSIRKVPSGHHEIVNYAKNRNPLNHMTVTFKKESVLKAGNYQPFLMNEDYFLWVRMIQKNYNFANIPEILVFARTGTEMFNRRGGIQYLIKEFELQKIFLNMCFINRRQYIRNIILRGFVRILPNSFRGLLYLKFLRN